MHLHFVLDNVIATTLLLVLAPTHHSLIVQYLGVGKHSANIYGIQVGIGLLCSDRERTPNGQRRLTSKREHHIATISGQAMISDSRFW